MLQLVTMSPGTYIILKNISMDQSFTQLVFIVGLFPEVGREFSHTSVLSNETHVGITMSPLLWILSTHLYGGQP